MVPGCPAPAPQPWQALIYNIWTLPLWTGQWRWIWTSASSQISPRHYKGFLQADILEMTVVFLDIIIWNLDPALLVFFISRKWLGKSRQHFAPGQSATSVTATATIGWMARKAYTLCTVFSAVCTGNCTPFSSRHYPWSVKSNWWSLNIVCCDLMSESP